MTKPRLVFLVTKDWYFVSHRLPLAVASMEAGFDVFVVTRLGEQAEAIREREIEAIHFPMARRGMNPLGLLREAVALLALYRRLQQDLVHYVALLPVVVSVLAARFARVPQVVVALTGMGFLFTVAQRLHRVRNALEKRPSRLLNRRVVVAQNLADWALLERLDVASEKIRLIPGSGVGVASFRPRDRAPNTALVVMMSSRMLLDKGIAEFIAVACWFAGQALCTCR